MTVFCIECGAAVDAADAVCNNCGAAQTTDDDAPIAAPSFPTAAVIAVKPPAEPVPPAEEEPPAPAEDELELPAPSFPTAAVMAVTPPPPPEPEPEPEPIAEEPELPAPSFPTAAVMAVTPPPPTPPAPEPPAPVVPPAPPAGMRSGDPLAAYLGAAPAAPQPAPAPAAGPPPVDPPTAPLGDPASPEPAPPAPPTSSCPKCGHALPPNAQFCSACGTPRAAADQPATPPPPPPPAGGPPRTSGPADWQASLPAPFRSLPADLLAVCALMAVAGLFTLWPVLDIIPDMLDLLTSGESFSRSLGLLALALWLVLAFVVGACFLLAWRIAHADRVARGLTYVLLGAFAASLLIGNVRSTSMTIAMLASGAAVAVLALAPGPRAVFAAGEQGSHPEGLVIARTLLTAWSGILIVVGVLFLPVSSLADRYVIVGLLFLVLGGAAILFNRRLADGDPVARIVVSAGAVVYLVLLFVLEDRSPSLLLPLGMAVGITVYLWLPGDVQRYFATKETPAA